MNNFIKLLNEYKFIILISFLGFIFTGLLPYPYGISWDDYYITQHRAQHLTYFTSHMGWFYAFLWRGLQEITGKVFAIGIFNNLIYWITMPVLYINLFSFSKNSLRYYFWYIVFSCSPFMIFYLMSIHSGGITAMFLLIAITNVYLYIKHRKIPFFFFALMGMLCAILIRRDAIFYALPLALFLGYQSKDWKYYVYSLIILFIVPKTLNPIIIENFNSKSFYTEGYSSSDYIVWYDMAAMSYHKKELVIPDQYLKESYIRNSNDQYKAVTKELILENIYKRFDECMFFDVSVYSADSNYGISPMLNVDPRAEKISNVWKIYLSNLPYYLWHRITISYYYIFGLGGTHIYDMNYIDRNEQNKFNNKIRILVEKIVRKLGLFAMLPYLLMNLFVLYALWRNYKKRFLEERDRDFSSILIFSSIFYFAILMVAVGGIQIRYVVWYAFSSWISFIFILAKLLSYYKIRIEKI